MTGPHDSHDLRLSDASTFDFMCRNCHRTDSVPGGWGRLTEPCPNPPVPPAVDQLADIVREEASADG